MNYKKSTLGWFSRALKEEKDEFVKFILFFITLEVISKIKGYISIRDLKKDEIIKRNFFSNIKSSIINELKLKLDNNPLENMKQDGDNRWNGTFKSTNDSPGSYLWLGGLYRPSAFLSANGIAGVHIKGLINGPSY